MRPNKFDQLNLIIKNKVDVLVITKAKLDSSFPDSQFIIDILDNFRQPCRFDRNRHGEGAIMFVRDDIPRKLLSKHTFLHDTKGIFIEFNLRKIKSLMLETYHLQTKQMTISSNL